MRALYMRRCNSSGTYIGRDVTNNCCVVRQSDILGLVVTGAHGRAADGRGRLCAVGNICALDIDAHRAWVADGTVDLSRARYRPRSPVRGERVCGSGRGRVFLGGRLSVVVVVAAVIDGGMLILAVARCRIGDSLRFGLRFSGSRHRGAFCDEGGTVDGRWGNFFSCSLGFDLN